MSQPLLALQGVARYYPAARGLGALWPGERPRQAALAPTDLSLAEGAALGLVGESGSGKTTLARIAAGLSRPSSGAVYWRGTPVSALDAASRAAWRRELQYVFQHPGAALNPRYRVRRILSQTLSGLWRGSQAGLPTGSQAGSQTGRDRNARHRRIDAVAEQVGLSRALLARYPHQLSGGQAQRVAIARALLGAPRLLILDEPVSALDLSLQAQILNLLAELRRELGLSYLFISHDLAVVERLCEQTCVMRAGEIIERGETARILRQPSAPYTRRLVEAVPRLRLSAGR
jgi:ABC-type glutathione transport system ATPase component